MGLRAAQGAIGLVAALAGCSPASPDPCDGRSPVCLGLSVEGSVGDLDALRFVVRGSAGLRDGDPTPPHAPFSLPIDIALLLPADTAGAVDVVVVGERSGMDVAAGSTTANVPPGSQRISVTLTAAVDQVPFPGNDDGPGAVATGTVDLSSSSCAGRSQPDAASFPVPVTLSAGAQSINLAADPVGLAPGDEILIIDLQGSAADSASVGSYETDFVIAIDGRALSLFQPLRNSYDGTTQKIVVQRVPHYATLDVAPGARLTAAAWDGTQGGIFAARVLGATTIEGTIDMSGKGYRGSKVGDANGPESYGGWLAPVAADGKDGTTVAGGDGGGTGTGGGTGHDAVSGDKGGMGHGGGGGGGRGFYQMSGWVAFGNGGGGGAFPSAGPTGPLSDANRLLLGSGGTQGAGGGGGGGYYSGQGGGGGGHSSGLGGSRGASNYTPAAIGGAGGDGTDGRPGGGVIALWAASVLAGPDAIVADGTAGGQGGIGGQAGGGIGGAGGGEGGQGAAGGTILLRAPALTLPQNGVHAAGGAGGAGGTGESGGGAGNAKGGAGALFTAGNDPGMDGLPGVLDNTCGGSPGGCFCAGGGSGRGGRSGFAGRVSQGPN